MTILSKLNLSDKTKVAMLTSPEARLRGKMLEALDLQMEAAKATSVTLCRIPVVVEEWRESAHDSVDGSHPPAYRCQNEVDVADRREVAVGKQVPPFPPRRSRRALLTHRAPPSGSGVEAVTG